MRAVLSAAASAAAVLGAAAGALAGDIHVPGDFRTIAEAAAAAAPGDRVVVARGTHRGSFSVRNPGIEIAAPDGARLRTRRARGSDDTPVALWVQADGVTLRGLTFENACLDIAAAGTVVVDCTFRRRGSRRDGANSLLAHGDRTAIEDTLFVLSGSRRNGATAIFAEGTGTTATGLEITGSVRWERGIVSRGDGAVVADNVIRAEEAAGVVVVGDEGLVSGNFVEGGFVRVDGDGATIEGNAVVESPFDAPGVWVDGDGNRIEDNTVEFGVDTGIVVRGDGNEVRGNAVRHNGSFRDAMALGHGIVVRGSGNRLFSNLVEGSLADGIRILGNDAWTPSGGTWMRIPLGPGNSVEGSAATDVGLCGLGNWTLWTAVTGCAFTGSSLDVVNGGTFEVFTGNEFDTGGPEFGGTGGGADLPDFGSPVDDWTNLSD